jgi:hypothetical protein
MGTLFSNTSLFVNAQVTPKWYFAIYAGILSALTVIAFLFFGQNQKTHYKCLFPNFCFSVTILCTGQAMYGILQYFNILPAGNGFQITGSFDNPAGFAASLCAGFPFLFYFVFKGKSWKRILAIAADVIVILAIFFSGSRAGIISLVALCLVTLFYRLTINRKWKIPALIALLIISLAGLYFFKKDSADGRMLIWRCSWEMIKDKPLFGHGSGGFKANYMNCQAKFFEEHPDSRYTMLADNVNRPFNEYILLLVNYGFAGFIIFFAVCWFLRKSFFRCRHENTVRLAGGCLLSIAVFAFFSYPLRYPFVWIMMILSAVVIVYKARYPIKVSRAVAYTLMILMVPLIILSGLATYKHMTAEILWRKTAYQSLAGKTEQMLPVYKRLHQLLAKNELFLYNYAAELNVAERYSKSLQIAYECERFWADYDLQMLIADNYEQQQQYKEAEQYYENAAAMCPVKFMPLYRLAKLYVEAGREDEALALANTILAKRVKVPSPTVSMIRNEMRQMAKDIKDTQQTQTQKQDEVSEATPIETVLPP